MCAWCRMRPATLVFLTLAFSPLPSITSRPAAQSSPTIASMPTTPAALVPASAAAARCTTGRHALLHARIDRDLRHWSTSGISAQLTDASLAHHTTHARQRCVGILFEGGVPYLLTNLSSLGLKPHHAVLVTAHLMLFQAVGRVFGATLPDVEFVLGTADEPSMRLDEPPLGRPAGEPPLPVLRFCKTEQHADILVPDIHFQMRRYNATLLAQVDAINAEYRWQDKRDEVFGRFSSYKRQVHVGLERVQRKGAGGANICKPSAKGLISCDVRGHFMNWSASQLQAHKLPLNVARQPRVKMKDHAKFKYLLHLDGQSCSSRLEQLLTMGSLVMKEESGYVAFFHHLLEPDKHYVPVWRKGPEDVLDALRWAQAHDADAARIARQGQQVASEFLNSESLTCYWYAVLTRLAALLRYKPSRERRQGYLQPVAEYLASSEGRGWVRRHKLDTMELP